MRVAVVGAGVSGLVVAHKLSGAHNVTVYEANDYAGGHSNTVRVDTADETHYIDTGFIVFNDRNYPLFRGLLTALGVASQPSTMSFGVSDDAGDFEYSNGSLNGFYARRRNVATLAFQRMAAEAVRCQREARKLAATQAQGGPSVGEWLEGLHFSRYFIDRMIVPLASAIWSADPLQIWSFPAHHMAAFFNNHGLLDTRHRPRWFTVVGGSQCYVEALTRGLGERVRLSAPIGLIERHPDHVIVTPRNGVAERFDEVVIATHSDQALAMLGDADQVERIVLGSFPYQNNEAVLHSDRSMLPRRRRAWASWNFHLLQEPTGLTTVTYYMNKLQRLDVSEHYCVTLNRTSKIDPARVIRTISYAHPTFTADGQAAQLRHAEISGRNRTHYCGAYWGWGFHEDGVASAVRVADHFGSHSHG